MGEKSEANGLPQAVRESQRSHGLLDVFRESTRAEYAYLACGIVLSVIQGLLMPFNGLIFAGITDTLMAGDRAYRKNELDNELFKTNMLNGIVLYFINGIAMFIVSYGANACLYVMCEQRLKYIRAKYFRAVMRQEMGWFDSQATGGLTQKMNAGTERIKDALSDKFGVIIQAIASFVGGIGFAFVMCWQLTLVQLVVMPLLLASMYFSGRNLSRAKKIEMTSYTSAGGIAQEVISGIRTVTAFNAQPQEIDRYQKHLDDGKETGIRSARIIAICTAIPLLLSFAIMGVSFWFGAQLIMNDVLTPGLMFGVFWSMMIGTRRLGEAAPQMGPLISARLAAVDLFEVIDRVPHIDSSCPDGKRPHTVLGELSFKNVEFTYPSRPDVKILKGVSYDAAAGETVALVGHSGCGKSTMIGLLLRFYEQDAGELTLDGVHIRDLNIEWLRNTIGVVQQEPIIFAATVEENIRMGDDSYTLQDIQDACEQANALEFIQKLSDNFQTKIGESGVQLSGGQKQRVAIARAIIRKPKILLLDEATSALDTESERIVQEALDKASKGRTTLCIAHRLSTVRNADKIIVFDAGLIVESGTHDELMEKESGTYRMLVKAQQMQKAEDDTVIADDEEPQLDRLALEKGEKQASLRASERTKQTIIQRDSTRLSQSIIGTQNVEQLWELDEAREELEEVGANEASLMDIIRFARPEWTRAAIGVVLSLIRGLTWPVFSIAYGQLFLLLSTGDNDYIRAHIILNCLWFVLIGIGSCIATYFGGNLLGGTGEEVSMRLRLQVFKNILRQDATYFDDPKNSVGALTSRLATDAPNVQVAIDQRLSEMINGLMSLLAGIVVAFCYGWNMAPIGLATALLLVICQNIVAQYLKYRGASDMACARDASRIVSETMSNVRTIQALTRQEYMFNAYSRASVEPYRRAIIRGLFSALNFAISSSFILLNFGIAYSFGLWLVLNRWASPFTVFQVIEALNMASVSVMVSAAYFPEYVRARISAGLMFGMIRQHPRIDNCSEHGERPVIKGDVSLHSAYFAYPVNRRNLVLNSMNLQAKFGQTVALVGPSGCGKSTVIQMLERYYDPLCGHVCIDGCDLRDLNIRHVRESMALVGQEPTLFNLSVRDNISYGLADTSQEAIERAARTANIHSFIESLPEGYDTPVGARGGRLSGGQKQRIAIARALVREPRILLLDEATSALDSESEKIVQEALDRAREGRTCFVIAHRLSTIQNADMILVCKDGKVIEQGNHQSLLARRGLYYKLVQKQSS